MTGSRRDIVVVGASFAGLSAAAALSPRHAVTVIDAARHFEWIPNLHELVSGVKTAPALRIDRRAAVERAGHRFVEDAVVALEPAQRRLHTARGRTYDFDACIVAAGAVAAVHGVPGAADHALPFRHIADAQAVARRLKDLRRRGTSMHIVIAGAGIVGIEVLGELLRRHRDAPGLRVDVVEPAARLLPGLPAALDADLRERCSPWPVRFRTGTGITRVTPKGVRLSDGSRLHADLVVWSAGLAPAPLLQAGGLTRAPDAWAAVRASLQSRRHDRIFVVGDAARLPTPLARQAYHAIDMGEHAAANAERLFAARPLRPFEPNPKPLLVAFGDLQTYLVAGPDVYASPLLAGAKEAVYQVFMAQMTPGGVAARLTSAARRLRLGWHGLALPQLLAMAGQRRLPSLRALNDDRDR